MRDPYLYEDGDVLKNRANIIRSFSEKPKLTLQTLPCLRFTIVSTINLQRTHYAIFTEQYSDRYLIGQGNSERFKWSSMKKSSAAILLDMHFQRISKKN